MLEDALRYAELGWFVFPCHTPLSKAGWSCSCEAFRRQKDPDFNCSNPGKHPRINDWQEKATTDPAQIRQWWKWWPTANIGIACGASGLLMVDRDTYKDFYKGQDLELNEETVTAISGGGGGHLVYKAEPGDPFGNSTKGLPDGIDIRGQGGLFVVAPSLHISGNRYQWEEGYSPWDIDPAPIPPKLREILEARHSRRPAPQSFDTAKKYNGTGASMYGKEALVKECAAVAAAPNGARNNTLNAAAFNIGQLVAGGELDHAFAFGELIKAAIECGLSDEEAERTAESGLDAGMDHPRSSKPLTDDEADLAATWAVVDCPDPALLWAGQPHDFDLLDYTPEDGGILDLWFDLYGKQRLYAVGFNAWFVWDKTNWRKDEDMAVKKEIEALIDAMNYKAREKYKEAKADDDKEGMRLYNGYISATRRTSNRVSSVDGMAQARCAVRSAILNTGNTLNLRNGVLDLDTLELRPHSQGEYLTYCLSYDYDPAATCPRFEQFVKEVLVKENTLNPDPELAQLYQEGMGYALTTDTRHEAMFWFSGDGGNGKTVAITVLQEMLGPLCINVSFEEMGRSSNYDLAEVSGRRVIFSTESERGGKLAEGHIKRIVSGERILARPIYGSPFEFKSTAKVFWGMNDLPVIKDTSNGVWRRLKLIPFLRTFTESDRDPELIGKLLKELSGILNYSLAGLKSLRARGRFPESSAVTSAVEEYRHENNPVQQWLDERTQPTYTPNQMPAVYPTTAKTLFDDYRTWSEQNGRLTLNSTNFGRELRRLKIPKNKDVRGIVYPLTLCNS